MGHPKVTAHAVAGELIPLTDVAQELLPKSNPPFLPAHHPTRHAPWSVVEVYTIIDCAGQDDDHEGSGSNSTDSGDGRRLSGGCDTDIGIAVAEPVAIVVTILLVLNAQVLMCGFDWLVHGCVRICFCVIRFVHKLTPPGCLGIH